MDILIVDDSAPMRRVVKAIVCDLAHRVHECGDGREALAAYERHRPDVVLMDIEMEGVDGIAATRLITDSHPEARVVIVTDYDDPDLHDAALAAGAQGFVAKDQLFALRQLLGELDDESTD